jgi:hypothetical protein
LLPLPPEYVAAETIPVHNNMPMNKAEIKIIFCNTAIIHPRYEMYKLINIYNLILIYIHRILYECFELSNFLQCEQVIIDCRI